MSQTLRLATPEDLRTEMGCELDRYLCDQWYGFAAERDGAVVGLGIVSRDQHGRLWVWVNMRERLSAFMLHRAVREHFDGLRDAGVERVYAFCSQSIVGSEKWLRRLGFVAAPELTTDPQHPVWICSLSN